MLRTAGLALVRAMWDRGVPRSIKTYNVAAQLCSECGVYLRALGLLDIMRSEGIAPDACTYNTVLKSCCETGDDAQALQLLYQVCATVMQTHHTRACIPYEAARCRQ